MQWMHSREKSALSHPHTICNNMTKSCGLYKKKERERERVIILRYNNIKILIKEYKYYEI